MTKVEGKELKAVIDEIFREFEKIAKENQKRE